MTQQLLTVKETAEVLRAHPNTVYGWIEKGLLRAQRLPTGSVRVTQEAIDEFVRGEVAEGRNGGDPCRSEDATTENTSKSS